MASSCIGSQYAVLMLELGLEYHEIEIKRVDNQHALRDTIYKLLEEWRRRNYDEATLRILLNTLKFLGLDASMIAKKIHGE